MNKWTFVCMTLLLAASSKLLIAEDYAGRGPGEFSCPLEERGCCPEDPCISGDEKICCPSNGGTFFEEWDPTLKVRVAGFWPASDRFREIYGNSMPSYQVEGGCTFLECYRFWVNFDWVYKRGHSDHLRNFTSINMYNLSTGVSFTHQLSDSFTAYAGIGPSFADISVHNRGAKKHKNENKFAAGVVVKSGLIYNINCRFFVDFFVDYLYEPTNFKNDVNVGGLKSGIGIGTHF